MEAEPHLREVVKTERLRKRNSGKVDHLPQLYLASALANIAGREQEAVRAFEAAVKAQRANGATSAISTVDIWTRANMGRMLRRMGRVADAQAIEDAAV